MAKKKATTKKKNKSGDFHAQTVLFKWALSQFGVESLPQFRERFQISPETKTGVNPRTGNHHAYEAIVNALPATTGSVLSLAKLSEYEQNILDHTRQINEARQKHGQPLVHWQYFQYLALLLSELYFDRYFDDAEALRDELNAFIWQHNAADEDNRVEPYPGEDTAREELSRLAFWCATGSGKTLLMHMHVRQFRHYHKQAVMAGTWPGLDQVLLVTPNSGLSKQHEKEFTWSGFEAEAGGENPANLFTGTVKRDVTILEITKFQDKQGPTTLATESFDGTNLVLVDEGHRGVKTEDSAWVKRRDRLARGGFTIEYSATFKEAITDESARNRYARSILADYAYRHFYRDGFGKDFSIFNLDEASQQRRYLTMALLLFYQQIKVWREAGGAAAGGGGLGPFGIEKPLWVFVGHTVVGKVSNNEDKESVSDVVKVLRFLAEFLDNPDQAKADLKDLLTNGFSAGTGTNVRNVLENRLPAIEDKGDVEKRATDTWAGILKEVFQAPGGGTLGVQLKSALSGELAVMVGEHLPFGVVNVGDPAAVRDACEKIGIVIHPEDDGKTSLFEAIDKPDSTINLLVGSRKFTEGWNSYRVSSIGLMHLGKSEGTQIIQLFGRGVRLRGYQGCMRRSSVIAEKPAVIPKHLRVLETLQVFGVKASYIGKFRDWIRDEVPEALDKQIWTLPVYRTLPDHKLKTIRLRDTIDGVLVKGRKAFDQIGPIVVLRPPNPGANKRERWLVKNPVRINWLPKVQGIVGSDRQITTSVGDQVAPQPKKLTPLHVQFLDLHELLFGLERFKAQKGLDRLHADIDGIRELLRADNWYQLLAADSDLDVRRVSNRGQWQRIAQQLVNQYAQKLHDYTRQLWESPYLEVAEIGENDDALNEPWTVETTAESQGDVTAIASMVTELNEAIEKDKLAKREFATFHIRTVVFGGHVYQPLFHIGKKAVIRLSPVGLNDSEADFVESLATWCETNPGREVFLLRNKAVTGLGFFQAGKFFPDFLLWVQTEDAQHLAFVDPKGLHNLDKGDPKIRFGLDEIPMIQKITTPQAPELKLHAFIVSDTPYSKLNWTDDSGRLVSKGALEDMGVLFQEDGGAAYISKLMNSILDESSVPS